MPLFSFLSRKKPEEPDSLSFKQNVSLFWDWYAENAQRFYDTIEAKNSSELVDEVSDATKNWLAGLGWVFGPGPDGKGHSFTLTAEGDPHRYFLTDYWLKAAPTLEGWTFYSSRQPSDSPLDGHTIKIRGESFKPDEFWITPVVDLEDECAHITAWHPLFEQLPENERYQILFLWLDEVLGERGTTDWIGKIDIDNSKLKNSFPILELGEFISQLRSEHGWETHAPGTMYTTYKLKDPREEFLRADIFVGSTSHMRIVQDYFSAEGNLDDPLEGSGASFLFLAFDKNLLPKGDEANARGKIEDSLIEALEAERSGICFGGAQGTQKTYIDLLIFDADRSLKLIVDALSHHNLPKGSAIYNFAGQTDTPLHVF